MTCTNCKVPMNLQCSCEECFGSHVPHQLCHVCLVLSRVMFRSGYFQKILTDAESKRKNMGL